MAHLWQAEVNFLGDLVHSNLVKLIGYCIEDDQRLLVYEFMPRGSLENHLFRSNSLPHLSPIFYIFSFFFALFNILLLKFFGFLYENKEGCSCQLVDSYDIA